MILQAFSLFRLHSKWAVFILWRITTLPECEKNGSKTSQQVPLRWVISSLYYIPSCLGEMLLWGNPHVTTELWRKQGKKKLSKFYFLQHIVHHFFSCSPICNKTRHTEILSSVLQLFLLHKSMMTKASRVPQVPHITVLISAKRGHTHTVSGRLPYSLHQLYSKLLKLTAFACSSAQVTSNIRSNKGWTVMLLHDNWQAPSVKPDLSCFVFVSL